jgi:hypothetical protein
MPDMKDIEKAFEENKGLKEVMFLLKALNCNLMLCAKAVEDFDDLSDDGKALFGGSILNMGSMYIASLTTIGVLATKLQDKKDWKKLTLN